MMLKNPCHQVWYLVLSTVFDEPSRDGEWKLALRLVLPFDLLLPSTRHSLSEEEEDHYKEGEHISSHSCTE